MTESVASPDGVGMGVGGVPFSLTPLFLLGGPQRSSCGLWAGLSREWEGEGRGRED